MFKFTSTATVIDLSFLFPEIRIIREGLGDDVFFTCTYTHLPNTINTMEVYFNPPSRKYVKGYQDVLGVLVNIPGKEDYIIVSNVHNWYWYSVFWKYGGVEFTTFHIDASELWPEALAHLKPGMKGLRIHQRVISHNQDLRHFHIWRKTGYKYSKGMDIIYAKSVIDNCNNTEATLVFLTSVIFTVWIAYINGSI